MKQFSGEKYQELLWHMLLRGVDGFFLWCLPQETIQELSLLHPVYAESFQYREFLNDGAPLTFEVPSRPGPVVSGLRLGNRVLVRRTDFDENLKPVEIEVGGRTLKVQREDGKCQILNLEQD
ncbi:MAG: hypothetical protein HY735_24660 [Verrucomicrobia bacterium]|nr:hypothetical protein [Verrucomicrobiota bacterium]